ncbi:MAG: electron transport complex subunit RsxE [Clostridia bacterium]
MSKGKILTNGIIKENPVFRLVLGTCPTLAVTTSALNGISMGLAVVFVLVCSNMMISLLRKLIPDIVRIPAFIMIAATFVSIVDMVMAKYLPDLYKTLGLFIPLIVVNCVILARAEAFASKNTVIDSALDGLGMGFGYTISLCIIGVIREFLGSGSFFGMEISFLQNTAMTIFVLPAGGFLIFGMVMALVNHITSCVETSKKGETKKRDLIERVVQKETETNVRIDVVNKILTDDKSSLDITKEVNELKKDIKPLNHEVDKDGNNNGVINENSNKDSDAKNSKEDK